MKRLIPLIPSCLLLVSILMLACWSAGEEIAGSPEANSQRWAGQRMARKYGQLAALGPWLKGVNQIGIFAGGPGGPLPPDEGLVRAAAMAQYALAPVVVRWDPTLPLQILDARVWPAWIERSDYEIVARPTPTSTCLLLRRRRP